MDPAMDTDVRRTNVMYVAGLILSIASICALPIGVWKMSDTFRMIESEKAPRPGDLTSGVQSATAILLTGVGAGFVGGVLVWLGLRRRGPEA